MGNIQVGRETGSDLPDSIVERSGHHVGSADHVWRRNAGGGSGGHQAWWYPATVTKVVDAGKSFGIAWQ